MIIIVIIVNIAVIIVLTTDYNGYCCYGNDCLHRLHHRYQPRGERREGCCLGSLRGRQVHLGLHSSSYRKPEANANEFPLHVPSWVGPTPSYSPVARAQHSAVSLFPVMVVVFDLPELCEPPTCQQPADTPAPQVWVLSAPQPLQSPRLLAMR